MLTRLNPRARSLVTAGVWLLMALLGLLPAAAETPPAFPALAKGGEPLRSAFNRDAGRVRLLLFIDPT